MSGEHLRQWVDADEIFSALDLHTEDWHSMEHSEQEQREHYLACDRALGEMRAVGLWVIGSLFWPTLLYYLGRDCSGQKNPYLQND
jgi:hypothetical protein